MGILLSVATDGNSSNGNNTVTLTPTLPLLINENDIIMNASEEKQEEQQKKQQEQVPVVIDKQPTRSNYTFYGDLDPVPCDGCCIWCPNPCDSGSHENGDSGCEGCSCGDCDCGDCDCGDCDCGDCDCGDCDCGDCDCGGCDCSGCNF